MKHLTLGQHPYHIQPWGNYYLNPTKSIRTEGLGDLSICSDELLLKILDSLDPKSLAKLSVVSKAFYCFASLDDFWKAFVLQRFEGNFTFTKTWRTTYILCLTGSIETCSSSSDLKIDGFYSDVLYQSWFCANLIIPEGWLKINNIQRKENLSFEMFRKEFEIPNIPVILTDVVDKWEASSTWNRSYFKNCFENHKVIVGNYEMCFEDYLHYCDQQNDEMPLYLFDKAILNKCSTLAHHFTVPEVFKEDLFADLGFENRPDFRWLIMGPKQSGSSFHKDPNCTSAWNAVICGSKKWILYPPNVLPPGVHESPDESEVATSISLIEWFLNFYEDTKTSQVKPMECILREGEVLFIPRGWWHLALNLEESIAITQNFVSSISLPHVLKFLKSKKTSLVSGLPIHQRERLYDEFLIALKKHHPAELKNALEGSTGSKRSLLSNLYEDKDTKTSNNSFKFKFF